MRRMARANRSKGYSRKLQIAISRRFLDSNLGAGGRLRSADANRVLAGDCSGRSRSKAEDRADCGHLSPMEQPQQVYEALGQWVRD
jgi:hypothetical protein